MEQNTKGYSEVTVYETNITMCTRMRMCFCGVGVT